jgi:hypothetical protein
VSAYTDVTGHQVDLYFLSRQLEQQATQTTNTTGR